MASAAEDGHGAWQQAVETERRPQKIRVEWIDTAKGLSSRDAPSRRATRRGGRPRGFEAGKAQQFSGAGSDAALLRGGGRICWACFVAIMVGSPEIARCSLRLAVRRLDRSSLAFLRACDPQSGQSV